MDTWPPPSLKVNAEAIANECEQAEVTPYHRPMLAPIHMAALLYLNETVHARHLWRRTSFRDEIFTDWWQVGKAMLEASDEAVVEAALQKCAQEHPEPLRTYAVEMAARPKGKPPVHQCELNQQVITFLETKKWNM